MDISDKVVLFKKQSDTEFKDVTDRIKYFTNEGKSYCITFEDGKTFHAKRQNVVIMKKLDDVDLDNYEVEYKGKIKPDITKIELYIDNLNNKRYKVFCKNGYNYICEQKDINFYKFSDSDKNLIAYWKSCACESNMNTILNMMCYQYDKLIVDPSSVLYFYINKINKQNQDNQEIICPFDFNNSQLKAIKLALSNKISIIKGPPGTGKTQTILNLLCNLIIKGKSIAVISANNTAIENIEVKLEKYGYKSIFASLGNGERKAEFFKNEVRNYQFPNVGEVTISTETLSCLSKLFTEENKAKSLNEEIEAIKLEQQYYEKFNHESLINVDKYKFKNSQSLINYVTMYQNDTKEKKFTVFLWLKLIFKYGFKKSLIRVHDRDKLISSLEYKYYSLKLNELSKELQKLNDLLEKNKLDKLKAEYETLSKKYLDYYISKNIPFDLKFTRKNYKNNFSEFIKRYPIITSTAISFMNSIKSDYMFDYVLIDEASQVTIPSVIPLLNKCKNIVIVGDDKQLPPIEKYNTVCQFDNEFDSNKQSLITSFMKIYPNMTTTLLEHYRCEPSIIGFCNIKYYDNQLIPFTTKDKDDQALNVYFTSNENHMRKINDGEQIGVYNQREIDTIGEIFNDPEIASIKHKKIGIVSPYRLQVDKLQNLYQDIECDTIHKFQGREKDIIIFSSVLDSKASKNNFEFVDNPNMINVTVSRAIKKFILITNENVFSEKGKEVHDLINYISYKSMNENLVKSKCVSIFDYLYKSKELERNKLIKDRPGKYDSEKLMRYLLDKMIKTEMYNQFAVQEQVKVKDIVQNMKEFSQDEINYIQNNCSVDFLIKDKVNQDIVCVIEVDGIKFHENNQKQLNKDALKNAIFNKCRIPLIRFKTNGSNEEEKIKRVFDGYLDRFKV